MFTMVDTPRLEKGLFIRLDISLSTCGFGTLQCPYGSTPMMEIFFSLVMIRIIAFGLYSSFFPTVPLFLKPTHATKNTIAIHADIAQKAARYPAMTASAWSCDGECSVTEDAIAAVIARPTELPIWETSWKTPPARDCTSTG
jgi:hypothetical protein